MLLVAMGGGGGQGTSIAHCRRPMISHQAAGEYELSRNRPQAQVHAIKTERLWCGLYLRRGVKPGVRRKPSTVQDQCQRYYSLGQRLYPLPYRSGPEKHVISGCMLLGVPSHINSDDSI
jgi:hypothetical protein